MNTVHSPSTQISFSCDPVTRCRTARFTGAITDRELLGAFEQLVRDPAYDTSMNDLIDLRDVTHMGVTSAGLHRLIALYDERGPTAMLTRNAIVAPTDVLYGVSRMFQTLRGEGLPAELEVFRTIDEAERWITDGPTTHG